MIWISTKKQGQASTKKRTTWRVYVYVYISTKLIFIWILFGVDLTISSSTLASEQLCDADQLTLSSHSTLCLGNKLTTLRNLIPDIVQRDLSISRRKIYIIPGYVIVTDYSKIR